MIQFDVCIFFIHRLKLNHQLETMSWAFTALVALKSCTTRGLLWGVVAAQQLAALVVLQAYLPGAQTDQRGEIKNQ